jgi:hypothetical protein
VGRWVAFFKKLPPFAFRSTGIKKAIQKPFENSPCPNISQSSYKNFYKEKDVIAFFCVVSLHGESKSATGYKKR